MPDAPAAAEFVRRLLEMQSDEELRKIGRYFKTGEGEYGHGDVFIGVRMGDVFRLAKEFVDLAPAEIETLLEDERHEVRAGAVSVMAKQAASKRTSDARRVELYDLYLRRHDRIDNWDLVDLGARDVIGVHLIDRDRSVLFDLARSDIVWERRTAIYATAAFLRVGQVDDTFAIAELLIDDPEDLIHKAVGGWLRHAGKTDPVRLRAFLDEHASTMPRVALRYALEHFEPGERAAYLART